MQVGRVVGTATSTVKHASLHGWKLLLVQLLGADGKSPDGDPILTIDPAGAGIGERVIVTSDGRTARELLKSDTCPVRWTVLGVCDE